MRVFHDDDDDGSTIEHGQGTTTTPSTGNAMCAWEDDDDDDDGLWAVWVTDHPPSAIGVERPDPTRPRNVAGRARKSDPSLIQTKSKKSGGSGSRGFRTGGWLFEMSPPSSREGCSLSLFL